MSLTLAERLVNEALATDPGFLEELGDFAGRRIHVVVSGLSGRLEITVRERGIKLAWLTAARTVPGEVAPPVWEQPDVELSGPPSALLRLATSLSGNSPVPAAPVSDVQVQGDMGMLDSLRSIAARLRLDWEALLAARVGDVAAHAIWQRATGVGAWRREAVETLERNLGEWLRYESQSAPGRAEVRAHCDEVDEVRDAADRLEARIERLTRMGAGRRVNR